MCDAATVGGEGNTCGQDPFIILPSRSKYVDQQQLKLQVHTASLNNVLGAACIKLIICSYYPDCHGDSDGAIICEQLMAQVSELQDKELAFLSRYLQVPNPAPNCCLARRHLQPVTVCLLLRRL